MEEDSWSFGLSSASSRIYQSTLKSHSDFFIEIDDFDGDEDLRLDFTCPFCSEDFDLPGLRCHIDEEHASESESESESGVCPVCDTRIGMDMVDHITTQHVNFFKGHQKLKPHKNEFSSHSLSRKELQDERFRSILGGSSAAVSSVSTSVMALDPLLSFLRIIPTTKPVQLRPVSSEASSVEEEEEEEEEEVESSEQKVLESDNHLPPLSDKDQEEKAQRCKFVQGLVLSTIFGDDDL